MNKHWVAAWGTSPSMTDLTPAHYAKNITLRYPLQMTIHGESIRLRFSNLFSAEDATLSRVTVTDGECKPIPVLFEGRVQGVIPAGGTLESDAAALEVHPGMRLVVNIYLGEYTNMISGVACQGPLSMGSYAMGDHCDDPVFDLMWAKDTGIYFFLTEADVLADEDVHALVCFGDSITSQFWPDYLTLRMLENGWDKVSIIRRGISGSRVLRQYDHLQHRHYGPKGMARFEREVNIPGADRVVVLHGVNDVIHPDGSHPARPWEHLPTVEQLIDGLRCYVNAAHSYGMKIALATITPIEGWRTDTPERRAILSKVNEWIRSNDEADLMADFAAAVCDPANPDHLHPECDSGDHLHPSMNGAKKMAYSLPEELLH